jgi:hypothetical protein
MFVLSLGGGGGGLLRAGILPQKRLFGIQEREKSEKRREK